MGRKLEVEIVGDASSLHRALGSAGKQTTGFGSKLGGLAKTAGIAAGAGGLLAVGFAAKDIASDMIAGQKATAQTNAVLKSTGGVSGVTTKHVQDLATAIRNKSGMDDEAVQSGENMLLTFTNIRNETGKGNKVFDQATSILADMSTAFGTDASKSAIQLGKALNDPIKGVGALSKIGVTFTEAQKKQIAGFMKTGDVAKAQGVILKELNKEVGGSAAAMGKTLPGQLNILKGHLEDVTEELVMKLQPAFEAAVGWITQNWPKISATLHDALEATKTDVLAVVGVLKQIGDALLPIGKEGAAAIDNVAKKLGGWKTVLEGAAAGFIAFKTVVLAQNIIMAISTAAAAGTMRAALISTGIGALAIVLGIAAVEIVKHWGAIKKAFSAAADYVGGIVSTLVGFIKRHWDLIVGILGGPLALAVAEIIKHWGAIKSTITGALGAIQGAIRTVAGAVFDWAMEIGRRIISGIISGLGDLVSKVTGALKHGIESAVHGAGSLLHGSGEYGFTKQAIGEKMGQGIADGIVRSGPLVQKALQSMLFQAVRARNFSNVSSIVNSIFAAKQSDVKTPAEKQIAGIERARNIGDLKQSIEDAKTAVANSAQALAEAQATGDAVAIAQAQAQLASDKRAEARAEQDLTLFYLQEKAAKQRAALDAQQMAQQIKLGLQLDHLNVLFEKHGVTIAQLMRAVRRILHNLHVPGFASGVRNFAGGLAIVGERGPELVSLPSGSDVIPFGGGGGSVVHVHYHGTIIQERDAAKTIATMLNRERARGNPMLLGTG